jgi:hypothetical protein
MQNLHKFRNYKSIVQHVCFCVNRKCKITYFYVTNNPLRLNVTFFSLCGLLQRICSILCRSTIKMATISRGYANLLPPWSFKITLSYIIQGPIKLKPKHHIDSNSLHDTLQSVVCIPSPTFHRNRSSACTSRYCF